ncbi:MULTISPECIES: bifunctional 4-hydroxy-2-oxoglutarate aldolase/2-dehydro-3-deoxy-phosphogluconate aldolase [Streptomycetaceae]|uniref:2-dehydro-3-deoxy-phosphogluconate aldolase n=1 Tax=Streptantibioticus cattleyicolor (strain ATCC 35852 / DSM 46488 / JCM 4925 / NBRC 14057 / NRRL 8057) TaxID=1003195 RepID=F8K347_STREN|nr:MULTISPECIES: bifunctional 4-hydroxy-2-oxoglutarate aldolase/2-dehydro-3-deoxy-phosphogluconate aldolase [Streptomycetaceae]AEW93759.1 2-keto-3-deoxygluconate 6-phosphate aldolase and 2-keto-4-hydroxyglutarate aldolase [Streptantibioticus cattleyicolor NRRL 8057 = DSM 46488]MYS58447.1 bifunctional 4-hydroxy-2-oxoglutarate aldolase/2-dehydro-3-deoxy-phosphogluconate aldolase [Streptomyces sp. SID5468]CCB74106.1 KHG/KDPG aldolase [Includes: 4-hydroxy-2-oxoglutarate aldolase; 2-dehydro-3-deoxy-p
MTSVLDLARVLPVVVLEDVADAVPLARALVAGGLPAIEVTLRTPAATAAIERIAAAVPEAVVGAGTVLSPRQARAAADAGARFLVSPGWTPRLLDAMAATGLPFLPGASTASEVMALLERGVGEVKFFPAEAAGGAAYLASLAGPLPGARFCPTGGIDAGRARAYLALPNVGCVGGSWMLPRSAVGAKDWPAVERLARAAAELTPAAAPGPSAPGVNPAGAPCR